MDPGQPSITAMGAALMRSVHTRLDRPALLDDPWGERLVFESDTASVRERQGVESAEDVETRLRSHPSYGTVILRARYTEDALEEAVRDGTRQYVIVGAGLDSFALRRPEWAEGVRVFEVDHPATQEFKLGRLAELGIEVPGDLVPVAADLSQIALDGALGASTFDPDQPAFFAWLGVMPYLPAEANLATLSAIARAAQAGGELVLSYIDRRVFDAVSSDFEELRGTMASMGEPWISALQPAALPGVLAEAGLDLVEDLGPDELAERYCAGRSDGLAPSRASRVARARIPVTTPRAEARRRSAAPPR